MDIFAGLGAQTQAAPKRAREEAVSVDEPEAKKQNVGDDHKPASLQAVDPTLSLSSVPSPRNHRNLATLEGVVAHNKGKRPSMEDAAVTISDLHHHMEACIIPAKGSARDGNRPVKLPDEVDPLDPVNMNGSFRKQASRFSRIMETIRETKVESSMPPMSFFGVYDGHGGRRAADFCAQWMHAFIYCELATTFMGNPGTVSIYTKPEGKAGSTAASPSVAPVGSNNLAPKEVAKAVVRAFEGLDALFLEEAKTSRWHDGCTAVTVFTVGDRLYCASLGDSRAIMIETEQGGKGKGKESPDVSPSTPASRPGAAAAGGSAAAPSPNAGPGLGAPKILSGKEHRPTQKAEAKRVASKGGSIQGNRVMGAIGVTRSIGDMDWKRYGLIATPSVMCYDRSRCAFIVIGCDGLWDGCHPNLVGRYVQQRLYPNHQDEAGSTAPREVDRKQASLAGEQLVVAAVEEYNSSDNVTAVIVYPRSPKA